MEYDDVDNEYIDLTVPVTYVIKKNLIEDMLTTLPHLSTSHSIGNLVIKFFESDFILSVVSAHLSLGQGRKGVVHKLRWPFWNDFGPLSSPD